MENQLDFRMLQAQLAHILRHGETAYVAMTAAQLLIIFGLWSAYPSTVLLLWFFSIQIVVLVRFIVCRKYSETELSLAQTDYLKLFFIINSFINGTLWGALSWLLSDTWDIHAFYILLPILGIFAGAMNLATILPVYFSLIMPILIQTLIVLIFSDVANSVLAGFFIIYYAGMIRFSLELHKMLIHTYRLQFELETTNHELVVQKQTAEKANNDKSRFLASASHDLRQPLYAMELFLGGLAQDEKGEKKNYLVQKLRSALDSMQIMFSSLLDMSRFDAGVITPTHKNHSSEILLQTLKVKFDDECKRKGIRLIIRSSSAWFYSDPILVQRVLENYITNAVKYTNSGGVLVACRQRGRYCCFEVWDTGRGIEKDDLTTIFDAFHQLENPERDRKKGVGLGLAIVDQIAKLLNAPIFVRSRIGQGSVFSISLPMGSVEAKLKDESTSKIDEDKTQLIDLGVWIVDDDEDILEGLQLQLETWGCITRTFDSPEQIQSFMEGNRELPKLLISDLRLRDHRNGIEVIKMVDKHCTGNLAAIIITGDTGPERLQEVTKAGFPLLHKPVTAEKLHQTIIETLKSVEDIPARR